MNDNELNRLFAVHVAGWSDYKANGVLAPFIHSADAVLPWLEKGYWLAEPCDMPQGRFRVMVRINGSTNMVTAYADTFPRAAVIALLKAHGVEAGTLIAPT